ARLVVPGTVAVPGAVSVTRTGRGPPLPDRARAPRRPVVAGTQSRRASGLPAVVDLGADQLVVDRADTGVDGFRERGQRGRGSVATRLVSVAGPWDDHADPRLVEDPPQGELGHGRPFRDQRTEPFHRGQAGGVVHPGEGLSHVERFTIAVEG